MHRVQTYSSQSTCKPRCELSLPTLGGEPKLLELLAQLHDLERGHVDGGRRGCSLRRRRLCLRFCLIKGLDRGSSVGLFEVLDVPVVVLDAEDGGLDLFSFVRS